MEDASSRDVISNLKGMRKRMAGGSSSYGVCMYGVQYIHRHRVLLVTVKSILYTTPGSKTGLNGTKEVP